MWRSRNQPYLALYFLLAFAVFFILQPRTVQSQQASDAVAPEFFTGKTKKKLVKSNSWMVAAANPYATKSGAQMIESGGNAVDAMVTVQLILGLVEPQSSGLGGGAFMVYWDAKNKKLTTFDGRETAPGVVDGKLFLSVEGKPMQFFDAVVGGRSVGTPGTLKLLKTVHEKYGRLPWKTVLQPAINLAKSGFKVSPRLNALISKSAQFLYRYETSRKYFLSEEGVPLFAGAILRNPAYAKTLEMVANQGIDVFYKGKIARDMVKAVQNARGNPGFLSMKDLADYKVIERNPVCASYREYDVCGMGPPSSGALTVGQILQLVEPFDLRKLGPSSAKAWRIIGDASRLAFADRGRYMADADFVNMPKGLLNADYMRQRSQLLRQGNSALPKSQIKPGDPPVDHTMRFEKFSDDASLELPSTSHFSIVDKQGNVVSVTTTIENGFGSRLMVDGFLLNNELTDFSFVPERGGYKVANRVEGGKRPRSSMSPTIIMKDGKPIAALGSPGGSRIIGYVAKTIIAYIDWGMSIQQAIELPHLVNRFGTYDLEKGTTATALASGLQKLGYKTKSRNLNSGLHAIVIKDSGLEGGADPRREGLAIGGNQ